MKQRGDSTYRFGPFRLSAGDRLVFNGDARVPLPPKAVDTLVMLVENAGRVVFKDALMQAVWADTYVEENNLNQAVSALRKALGQREGGEVYIETIPRRGYRFVARVTGGDSPEAPAPVEHAPVEHAPA